MSKTMIRLQKLIDAFDDAAQERGASDYTATSEAMEDAIRHEYSVAKLKLMGAIRNLVKKVEV